MNQIEELKAEMLDAMKNRDTIKKNVLRVVLGECERDNASPEKVIRKIIQNNEESLSHRESEDLRKENEVLRTYLPVTLSQSEIMSYIQFESSVLHNEILAAKSDGQATGLAVAHFKKHGKNVLGNDVAAVIKQIRGANT